MVVVTVQYRLGYLGFFSLGDEQLLPDNLGLHDLTMALQWVQENIAVFGGDPDNVTLAGQSAGGALVDLLAVSPLTSGECSLESSSSCWLPDLFQKLMPLAGNSHGFWALHDDVLDRCRRRIRKLGIGAEVRGPELLEQLRAVPASKLTGRLKSVSVQSRSLHIADVGPRLSAPFFPAPLAELRRRAAKKPVLTGVCEHEGLLFRKFGSSHSQHPKKWSTES